MILLIEEALSESTCSTVKPELTGKDTIVKTGDTFDPLKLVSFEDAELSHLKDSITFTTGLSTMDNTLYYSDVEGEFMINYSVTNECGLSAELELKVTVSDNPTCQIPNFVMDSDTVYYYIGEDLDLTDLGILEGFVESSDEIVSTDIQLLENGYTQTIQTYQSGATLTLVSDVDFKTVGNYVAVYTAENDCGIANTTISILVRNGSDNSSEGSTITSKPQTGDNAYIYMGLFIVAVVVLVAINIKKDDEVLENTNKDLENIDENSLKDLDETLEDTNKDSLTNEDSNDIE
jgi:hypothetical protein